MKFDVHKRPQAAEYPEKLLPSFVVVDNDESLQAFNGEVQSLQHAYAQARHSRRALWGLQKCVAILEDGDKADLVDPSRVSEA